MHVRGSVLALRLAHTPRYTRARARLARSDLELAQSGLESLLGAHLGEHSVACLLAMACLRSMALRVLHLRATR